MAKLFNEVYEIGLVEFCDGSEAFYIQLVCLTYMHFKYYIYPVYKKSKLNVCEKNTPIN